MATNFPNSVDSLTNPTTSDTLASVSHSAQHTDANDAIEAIETALLDGAPLHIDDTNERVGIGTTSPSAELDIKGASNPEIRLQSTDSSDPFLYFGDQVDAVRGGIGYDTSADALLLRGYNNSTRMTIDSSGNVGINDTTPSYKLDVNGDINAQGYVRNKGKTVGMAHIYEGSLNGGISTFLGIFNNDYNNYRIVVDAAQNGNTTWTYLRFIDSSNSGIFTGYYTAYFIDGVFSRQNNQSAAVGMFGSYFAYGGMVMDITLPLGDNPSFHISSAGHNPYNSNVYSLWCHGYCATSLDITGFQFYNGAPYGSVNVYGY